MQPYGLVARFYDQLHDPAPMNRRARQKILGKILPRVRSVGDLRAWDAAEVRPRSLRSRPGFDRYFLAQKGDSAGRKLSAGRGGIAG